MRAILIGAAAVAGRSLESELARLRPGAQDLRIGVDGGVSAWLSLGVRPDFAVGDWDSLKRRGVLTQLRHLSLPRGKDRSDLFFAACAAVWAGARELICLGVTGGRPDHHIAMLFDLAEIASGVAGRVDSVRAIGPDGEYVFLSTRIPRWRGKLARGRLVSCFSLRGTARGVTLKGFEYPLKDQALAPSSHGLSNHVRSSECEVRLRKGRMLVLIPREPESL